MYQINVTQEMAQVRRALEHERETGPFRGLIFLFWGIIIAKCVLIEWAMQRWPMPFSSSFLWIPTLLFTALATLVYGRARLGQPLRRPLTGQFVSAVWIGCLTAGGLLTVACVVFHTAPVYLLPAMLSALMGAGYFIHGALSHRGLFRACAIGWWASSLLLFVNPNVNALAWFALVIILFQVLPTAWLHRESVRPRMRLAQ